MEKQKQKTEEEWRCLQKAAIAILNGLCANEYYGEMSMNTLVSEALSGADLLVKKLKEREKKETTTEQ